MRDDNTFIFFPYAQPKLGTDFESRVASSKTPTEAQPHRSSSAERMRKFHFN